MLKINNLTFNYKNEENKIFENAEIELEKGIWLLEGDNGSGKSTFFKVLTGAYGDIGEISEDTCVDIKGNVIFLDNETSLPPNLNELDIAKYIFYINDISLEKEYVPIYNNRNLGSYSTGERKIAALRILSHLSVDILLIDEYITNIDENNVTEAMEILREISSKGTLIIISSNEVDIKNRFQNKILVRDKKLEVIGLE